MSAKLGKLCGDLVDFMKVHFLTTGEHFATDSIDGIHITPASNKGLGKTAASKAGQIFEAEMDTSAA